MPEADTDQRPRPSQGPYSQAYLSEILRSVKTIAIVGASANTTKPSHDVLCALRDAGYDVIPVNPNPAVTEIRGIPVVDSLNEIDRPVDMVDVFRPKVELYGLAEQAIAIGARVLWAQLGIHDDAAARLAEDAGLTVVMDRCPKIELSRAM